MIPAGGEPLRLEFEPELIVPLAVTDTLLDADAAMEVAWLSATMPLLPALTMSPFDRETLTLDDHVPAFPPSRLRA